MNGFLIDGGFLFGSLRLLEPCIKDFLKGLSRLTKLLLRNGVANDFPEFFKHLIAPYAIEL